ncbi:MAG: HEPN domain-containing protein [Desulfuromonadaceae bacterium]|nr:HEPN domain-containing protein [Desulfuromonadaceae bacterium]
MSDTKREMVTHWLLKAKRDLQSARALVAVSPPLRDTAIFHCQQAAEKVLKGFLAHHQQRLERTHDVGQLLEYAVTIAPQLAQLSDAAELLTPYATEYRYPGDFVEPDQAEFDEAYEAADLICRTIMAHLPE